MPKKLQSQWEFGELFPAEEIRKVLSVTEITGSIRRLLEKELGQVWVTGEISNLRFQPSGHVYFTLKDAGAQLSCVLFRNEARSVNLDYLADGQKVVLQGEVTVYEARGQYQLRVASVQLRGVGALQASFERLKQKLQDEGLFEPERKRALPGFPHRVGVVTSPTGAALRDVLHAIERRNPSLELILVPCRVQGAGAAQEIAAAIQALNEWSGNDGGETLDLILVTRGGGSLEDLWAFNEEVVARAIFHSRLPVISAVGHEIDFTISDFVADFRAATPTAAGEIITEGFFSARQFIGQATEALHQLVTEHFGIKSGELHRALQRLNRLHPRRKLEEHGQRLDDLHGQIGRCAKTHIRHLKLRFEHAVNRFIRNRPDAVLHYRREALLRLQARLHENIRLSLRAREGQVREAETRLRLLSPQNVLDRGYSLTMDAASGKVLREASEARQGQQIISRLKSGEIRSVVEKTQGETR